jgi:hypothetical protein
MSLLLFKFKSSCLQSFIYFHLSKCHMLLCIRDLKIFGTYSAFFIYSLVKRHVTAPPLIFAACSLGGLDPHMSRSA